MTLPPAIRLSAIALLLAAALPVFASTPPPLPIGPWSGAAGIPGSSMVPDPDAVPVEFFEEGLAGRLQITLAKPSAKAPHGAYTAQLALLHGNQTLSYRHSGMVAANGTISETWSASSGPSLRVTLARSPMGPEAAFLVGEATLGSIRYPLFALPHTITAKNPLPLGSDGLHSLFLQNIAIQAGTGFGTATIARTGAVKIAATLPNGTKATLSSAILLGGSTPFLAAAGPAGKTGFLGAWALRDTSSPDSDWDGHALLSPSSPSFARLILAASPKPAKGQPVFPAANAMLDLQLNPDFFAANGQLAFDGKSRFRTASTLGAILDGANAWGVSLLSLSLNPSSGAATGGIEYFFIPAPGTPARRERATLSGMLNRKTGEIHGRIQGSRALSLSGPLQVTPLR
jgi:hypothetical protein